MERSEIVLHGHRVSYRLHGRGPLLVLLHGIAGSSATWDEVVPRLGESHTVLAPDLLGHGESSKPDGDYSLGAYANAVRDLLEALDLPRGTIVGHSLGGGVAMQLAYQYPERCERLVLVSSGGLGRELHAMLRAAALPGAGVVLPWLCVAGRHSVGRMVHALGSLGLRASADLEETWRSFVSLEEPEARQAFLRTVRGLIDLGGQRVSATDRLYLTAGLPTLIVWGARDPLIPVRHAHEAHARMEGSHLEILPAAGHFPHRDAPQRFVSALLDFVETTPPLPSTRSACGAACAPGRSRAPLAERRESPPGVRPGRTGPGRRLPAGLAHVPELAELLDPPRLLPIRPRVPLGAAPGRQVQGGPRALVVPHPQLEAEVAADEEEAAQRLVVAPGPRPAGEGHAEEDEGGPAPAPPRPEPRDLERDEPQGHGEERRGHEEREACRQAERERAAVRGTPALPPHQEGGHHQADRDGRRRLHVAGQARQEGAHEPGDEPGRGPRPSRSPSRAASRT